MSRLKRESRSGHGGCDASRFRTRRDGPLSAGRPRRTLVEGRRRRDRRPRTLRPLAGPDPERGQAPGRVQDVLHGVRSRPRLPGVARTDHERILRRWRDLGARKRRQACASRHVRHASSRMPGRDSAARRGVPNVRRGAVPQRAQLCGQRILRRRAQLRA
jgi:hypothetical protein